MTLQELQGRVSTAIKRLDEELLTQAEKAGRDLVALVTNRVVQKGQKADGGQFTPYSENKYPAHMYEGQSRTSSADNKVKALAKQGKRISYKEFRAINGLNTSPKNFEFTGEMWRQFGVLRVSKTASGVLIVFGGQTPDAAMKIADNTNREKVSIIKPSKAEIAIVKANLVRWAQSVVDNGRTS